MENEKKKILIVDDDGAGRASLREALGGDAEIFEAADGIEAMAFLQKHTDVALMLLDFQMPRMDGLELLMRVRLSPRFSDLPVVMMFADPLEENRRRGLLPGATKSVCKPCGKTVRPLVSELLALPRAKTDPAAGAQPIDGGVMVLKADGKGVFFPLYVAPSFAMLCGRGAAEHEALAKAGASFLETMRPEGFESFQAAAQAVADGTGALVSFAAHVEKEGGRSAALAFFGRCFLVGGGKSPIVCLLAVPRAEDELLEPCADADVLLLDGLTGVLSREAFMRAARRFIDDRPNEKMVLVTTDIDRFKVINDLFGARAGDSVLMRVGSLLSREAFGRGICGRLSGDVFAFCLREEDFDLEAMLQSQRFLSENIGLDYNLVLHNGIYPVLEPGIDVSRMCDRANLARMAVKGDYTRRYAYYDEDMRHSILAEQNILNDMQRALSDGAFVLYLQPVYSLNFNKTVSAEALVRWNHPDKGVIEPGHFIPLFERNRFITNLDHYMWELTCRYIADRRERGLPHIPISVNVSRVNLFQSDLVMDLTALLDKYRLTPSMLRLEITESAYMDDPSQLIAASENLRKAGFKIIVDDFGSGYSSLNMLKDIPLDMLKLDMKFISGIGPSSRAASVLFGVIRIAQSLGMMTVAEGVETKFQVDFLRSLGCDNIQGYYYAKPLPVKEFERFLHDAPVI